MVVPRIWVPIPKTRVNCPNVKKKHFFAFFGVTLQKISSGCQSDNFDPRRSAYGSSESLCPIFFKTPAKKVIIFKIVGASPLQSQVIKNRVTKKHCFLSIFLEKMAIFTHFDQTNPPPWYTSLESCASQLSGRQAKNKFSSTSKPWEFW